MPCRPEQSTALGIPQFLVAFTDYLGVAGIDRVSFDGVLYLDSAVRFADITDGLSNTLAVGERPPSADRRLGWWYAGWGQRKDGSAEYLLGTREMNVTDGYLACPRGPYDFGPGRLDNRCDAFHFWSLHAGGAHFLHADGAVRFLPYAANEVLPALSTRAGGDVDLGS